MDGFYSILHVLRMRFISYFSGANNLQIQIVRTERNFKNDLIKQSLTLENY
jgi:hypothetical protein